VSKIVELIVIKMHLLCRCRGSREQAVNEVRTAGCLLLQHKLVALVALLFQLRLQGALTEEEIDMTIRVAACERGP